MNAPPSEVFREMLWEVFSKLGLTVKTSEALIEKSGERPEVKVELPPSPLEMVRTPGGSFVRDAYNLQLLGTLYPLETTAREHLFERSLVTLTRVSPGAPGYAPLKARALMNLHRRPAALAALGSPRTPEARALGDILEGNLVEGEKHIGAILSPLKRLIAAVELNDLRVRYGGFHDTEVYWSTAQGYPGWETLIMHRLTHKYPWSVYDNSEIKGLLDRGFPIDGFSLADLTGGDPVSLGFASEYEAVSLSPHEHYKRVVGGDYGRFCCKEASTGTVEADYLDLLLGLAESNLIKTVEPRVHVQKTAQAGLDLLDTYDKVYLGHDKFTMLRAAALDKLKYATSEITELVRLGTKSMELSYDSFYWSQGQNPSSKLYELYSLPNKKGSECYDTDFPRREYWYIRKAPYDKLLNRVKGDKAMAYYFLNMERALLYTGDDFYKLKNLHSALMREGFHEKALGLLRKEGHRFVGDQYRALYLGFEEQKQDDFKGARVLYEEAMAFDPEAWGAYRELGAMYIKNGELEKGFDVMSAYPPFSDDAFEDRVMLSNAAESAARYFYYLGEVGVASSFYELSATSQTGSLAEFDSWARLALFDDNYLRAINTFLGCAEHYDDDGCYAEARALMYLAGERKRSLKVFKSMRMKYTRDSIVLPALVRHRMEGTPYERLLEWATKAEVRRAKNKHIAEFFVKHYMMDRPPDPGLADRVEHVWSVLAPEGTQHSEHYLVWFSKGYYQLRAGNFKKAFDHFDKRLKKAKGAKLDYYWYAMPYVAWSAAESNRWAKAKPYLERYRTLHGRDFYYNLSMAFKRGADGREKAALALLEGAFNSLSTSGRVDVVFCWYQLVEAGEWLYAKTGSSKYRELVLDWSRRYQKIYPFFSWAYAVEAKYSEPGPERLRALALTLYLDKDSERVSGFSEEEKAEALEWLGDNNPFVPTLSERLVDYKERVTRQVLIYLSPVIRRVVGVVAYLLNLIGLG